MRKYSSSILLLTGAIATIIYTLHVVTGGLLWEHYNHLQQPISDLTASGAPDRKLLLVFTTIYGILALIFATLFTVFESRKYSRYVYRGGVCFMLLHFVSVIYGLFPEDLAGTATTFSGDMHIIITVLIVPFTILSPLLTGIGLLKEKEWRSFAKYSIITAIAVFVLGATSGIFYANKLPYFGLVERLNIGSLQLWTFIFSVKSYTVSKRSFNDL